MKNIVVFSLFILSACGYMSGGQNTSRAFQLIDQGILQLRSGKLSKAEAAFEVARDMLPMSAAVYDGLGCVAMMRGDFVRAEKYLLHASLLDAQYREVYANLAILYEMTGHKDDASLMYRYARQIDPENFRVRNNYAAFQFRRGRGTTETALKELLRAEALAPHPVIVDNIRRLR